MNELPKNILLIDKPKGLTSFDVLRKLKKQYPKGTKMGHAGTLDPNASGLMIVGINEGTKELKHFIGLDKIYEADVLLGVKTDSGDITGEIVESKKVESVKEKEIQKTLEDMVGPIRLPVSKYSAKRIGGKKAYELARSGEEMPTILQDMDIHSVEVLDHYRDGDRYLLKLQIEVSSGTYIRSITEEIGRRLNLPATLKDLRRLSIGNYKVANAEKLC